jgi:hypothetical protein
VKLAQKDANRRDEDDDQSQMRQRGSLSREAVVVRLHGPNAVQRSLT